MSAQYLTVSELLRRMPGAACSDCGEDLSDRAESEVWTIWNRTMVYCPQCAHEEGVGPDD